LRKRKKGRKEGRKKKKKKKQRKEQTDTKNTPYFALMFFSGSKSNALPHFFLSFSSIIEMGHFGKRTYRLFTTSPLITTTSASNKFVFFTTSPRYFFDLEPI
jgi:hypothetical protein